MNVSGPSEITQLLREARFGSDDAKSALVERVYPELRKIAACLMSSERSDHSLPTTALVNEAYLRLVKTAEVDWHDRAHFFALAARVMRHILVDYARGWSTRKRGVDYKIIDLDACFVAVPGR